MTRTPFMMAIAVAAIAAPALSSAQSGTPVSLQASLLYVGLSGEGYAGSGGGIGAEGQVRYNFVNSMSLGGGLQYSRHSFPEGVNLDNPLTLFGVFVEPRYVIRTSSPKLAPYASARIAFLRQSTKVGNLDQSASGTQLNAGGGVLVALNALINLDLGVTFGSVRFGKYKQSVTGKDAGSGTNVVLRAGLSLGVGT